MQVKDSIPVLLVNGKPAAKVFDQAPEYLKFALNPIFKKGAPSISPIKPAFPRVLALPRSVGVPTQYPPSRPKIPIFSRKEHLFRRFGGVQSATL